MLTHLQCLELCETSYLAKQDQGSNDAWLVRMLNRYECQDAIAGNVVGSEWIAFREGTDAVVLTRGSDDQFDWLVNAFAKKELAFTVEGAPLFAHAGFMRSARKIMESGLRSWLRQATRESQHVWFVGHSKGAAINTCLALELACDKQPFTLWSVGSPRAVDSAAADVIEQSAVGIYRFVNSTDIVTWLPASLPLPYVGGFAHVGHARYFDRHCDLHGAARQDALAWYLWETIATLWEQLGNRKLDAVEHHLLRSYRECFETAIRRRHPLFREDWEV